MGALTGQRSGASLQGAQEKVKSQDTSKDQHLLPQRRYCRDFGSHVSETAEECAAAMIGIWSLN